MRHCFLTMGKLRNIIVSVRDITHFRTADEIKSTFISIVSHELRTPVTLIKGYASTLRRDDAKWDKHTISDSLTVIEEEADRLSKMIDDLLDASRLQAGGLSLNRGDVSLPILAKTCCRKTQLHRSNQHTIVTDFPENFPVILADETRIEQVIINLVSNALKYAPKGEIKISGQVRPEQVIICVSDRGTRHRSQGSAAHLRPFLSLDESRQTDKRRGAGTLSRACHCRSPRRAHLGGRPTSSPQPRIRSRCEDLFLPSTLTPSALLLSVHLSQI